MPAELGLCLVWGQFAQSLELGALVGVDPGDVLVGRRCRDHDGSIDTLRVTRGESQRDAPARRPADDADPLDVQAVEHGRDVVRRRSDGRDAAAGDGIRAPVARPVDREK